MNNKYCHTIATILILATLALTIFCFNSPKISVDDQRDERIFADYANGWQIKYSEEVIETHLYSEKWPDELINASFLAKNNTDSFILFSVGVSKTEFDSLQSLLEKTETDLVIERYTTVQNIPAVVRVSPVYASTRYIMFVKDGKVFSIDTNEMADYKKILAGFSFIP